MKTMFDARCQSEPVASVTRVGLDRIRVTGGVRLGISQRDGVSYLTDRQERDGYKIRVPNRRDRLEAAVINTGGGIAGGDRIEIAIDAAEDTSATVTSPAAERVYASHSTAVASYDLTMTLAAGADLQWMPQETILFDQARLSRTLTAHVDAGARLLIAETLVFGRQARGECIRTGVFEDRWDIYRERKPVFIERIRLDGDIADQLDVAAIAGGRVALTTMLLVGEGAEDLLPVVLKTIDDIPIASDAAYVGASAWDGRLLLRCLSQSSAIARTISEHVLPVVGRTAVPRVWNC